MDITKSHTSVVNDTVRMAVGFSKVDTVNRLVSGFATLDNIDTQDDIVDTAASMAAFTAWRKNVREMHMPVAVGRVVKFTPDEFYDTKANRYYSGVWVEAYVSTGAESTWQKVLDGTLTGFSIGGNVLDSITKFDSESGRTIRRITEYELVELSLVDNPANQLANIFSVTKSEDGVDMMKGLALTMNSANAFYCEEDEIGKTSPDETVDCLSCGHAMKSVGWFEYDSSEERAEKFAAAINSYRTTIKQDNPVTDEGGVDVADTTVHEEAAAEVEEVETPVVVEEVKTEEVVVEEAVETPSVEEAAEVSEVADATTDIEKMFGSLRDDISKQLTDNSEQVAEFIKGFDVKTEELSKQYTELSERIGAITEQMASVEKSVGILDNATAVKKSGDLGGSTVVEKSSTTTKVPFWGGSILTD